MSVCSEANKHAQNLLLVAAVYMTGFLWLSVSSSKANKHVQNL